MKRRMKQWVGGIFTVCLFLMGSTAHADIVTKAGEVIVKGATVAGDNLANSFVSTLTDVGLHALEGTLETGIEGALTLAPVEDMSYTGLLPDQELIPSTGTDDLLFVLEDPSLVALPELPEGVTPEEMAAFVEEMNGRRAARAALGPQAEMIDFPGLVEPTPEVLAQSRMLSLMMGRGLTLAQLNANITRAISTSGQEIPGLYDLTKKMEELFYVSLSDFDDAANDFWLPKDVSTFTRYMHESKVETDLDRAYWKYRNMLADVRKYMQTVKMNLADQMEAGPETKTLVLDRETINSLWEQNRSWIRKIDQFCKDYTHDIPQDLYDIFTDLGELDGYYRTLLNEPMLAHDKVVTYMTQKALHLPYVSGAYNNSGKWKPMKKETINNHFIKVTEKEDISEIYRRYVNLLAVMQSYMQDVNHALSNQVNESQIVDRTKFELLLMRAETDAKLINNFVDNYMAVIPNDLDTILGDVETLEHYFRLMLDKPLPPGNVTYPL